ncbi:hypothetical protein R0135_04720 [Congregibacter variabilis]|uniref:MetA-pathway of phenol degradation n=1 Tax=Congregibacter variabilis TaxID=3081200 RepID=A0ABZ0I4P4_9GAMM|nr:hypothetical protein R0135_04720 [Congregibacter sp. IMCC43200]
MSGAAQLKTGVCLFLICLAQVSPEASAQSPITIEQLLAKPSTWQISSSLDYRSAMSEPTLLERQGSWLVGLRYGLSQRLELNARLQEQQFSQSGADQKIREKSHRLSVGSNWLIKRESTLPAVLLEARAIISSSSENGRRTLPGGQIAITTYKGIDPLVLSLSISMSFQRDYRLHRLEIDPGSSWRVEPGVNFAVNPRVTLFGGAAFERRTATDLGSGVVLPTSERLGIHGGMALSVARQHSIFVSVDLGTDRSGGMTLQWFYEF